MVVPRPSLASTHTHTHVGCEQHTHTRIKKHVRTTLRLDVQSDGVVRAEKSLRKLLPHVLHDPVRVCVFVRSQAHISFRLSEIDCVRLRPCVYVRDVRRYLSLIAYVTLSGENNLPFYRDSVVVLCACCFSIFH